LRFEKKIGSGGFGEVWKGEWIGTTVAIKKIMRHDIREEDLQEFTSEILLMT
jgi:serine/threonine protein kinase